MDEGCLRQLAIVHRAFVLSPIDIARLQLTGSDRLLPAVAPTLCRHLVVSRTVSYALPIIADATVMGWSPARG